MPSSSQAPLFQQQTTSSQLRLHPRHHPDIQYFSPTIRDPSSLLPHRQIPSLLRNPSPGPSLSNVTAPKPKLLRDAEQHQGFPTGVVLNQRGSKSSGTATFKSPTLSSFPKVGRRFSLYDGCPTNGLTDDSARPHGPSTGTTMMLDLGRKTAPPHSTLDRSNHQVHKPPIIHRRRLSATPSCSEYGQTLSYCNGDVPIRDDVGIKKGRSQSLCSTSPTKDLRRSNTTLLKRPRSNSHHRFAAASSKMSSSSSCLKSRRSSSMDESANGSLPMEANGGWIAESVPLPPCGVNMETTEETKLPPEPSFLYPGSRRFPAIPKALSYPMHPQQHPQVQDPPSDPPSLDIKSMRSTLDAFPLDSPGSQDCSGRSTEETIPPPSIEKPIHDHGHPLPHPKHQNTFEVEQQTKQQQVLSEPVSQHQQAERQLATKPQWQQKKRKCNDSLEEPVGPSKSMPEVLLHQQQHQPVLIANCVLAVSQFLTEYWKYETENFNRGTQHFIDELVEQLKIVIPNEGREVTASESFSQYAQLQQEHLDGQSDEHAQTDPFNLQDVIAPCATHLVNGPTMKSFTVHRIQEAVTTRIMNILAVHGQTQKDKKIQSIQCPSMEQCYSNPPCPQQSVVLDQQLLSPRRTSDGLKMHEGHSTTRQEENAREESKEVSKEVSKLDSLQAFEETDTPSQSNSKNKRRRIVLRNRSITTEDGLSRCETSASEWTSCSEKLDGLIYTMKQFTDEQVHSQNQKLERLIHSMNQLQDQQTTTVLLLQQCAPFPQQLSQQYGVQRNTPPRTPLRERPVPAIPGARTSSSSQLNGRGKHLLTMDRSGNHSQHHETYDTPCSWALSESMGLTESRMTMSMSHLPIPTGGHLSASITGVCSSGIYACGNGIHGGSGGIPHLNHVRNQHLDVMRKFQHQSVDLHEDENHRQAMVMDEDSSLGASVGKFFNEDRFQTLLSYDNDSQQCLSHHSIKNSTRTNPMSTKQTSSPSVSSHCGPDTNASSSLLDVALDHQLLNISALDFSGSDCALPRVVNVASIDSVTSRQPVQFLHPSQQQKQKGRGESLPDLQDPDDHDPVDGIITSSFFSPSVLNSNSNHSKSTTVSNLELSTLGVSRLGTITEVDSSQDSEASFQKGLPRQDPLWTVSQNSSEKDPHNLLFRCSTPTASSNELPFHPSSDTSTASTTSALHGFQHSIDQEDINDRMMEQQQSSSVGEYGSP